MHRTLVLDLDGTLVDTVDDIASALNVVLRARGLPKADRAEVRGLVGNGVHALLASACTARNAAMDAAIEADFVAYYREHVAVMSRIFPGAVAAIESMSAQGWRFAVCTNKPEHAARSLLERLALASWFSVIGGGDSFPFRKPDPAHLVATIKAAGGTIENAVMIGDHANDIRAAAGAGIPSIFAAWGYGPVSMADGCTEIAEGFAEIEALCERLCPRAQGSGP